MKFVLDMSTILLAITFIISVIHSVADNSIDTVKKFNAEEFRKEVPQRNHFVLFFAPWSGDCKGVAGIWEELGLKYNTQENSDVVIAKVDCTIETDLCAQNDVSDYPTVKFYKTGDEGGVKHRGVNDFQSLEQFMNRNIGKEAEFVYGARVERIPEPEMGLHILQDENFDDAVASAKAFVNFCTPWSSKCMDLEKVWLEIAQEFMFEDGFIIGKVDCSMHKTTCNENEVRGYPTILWLEDGVVVEKYPSKQRDVESLKTYILKKLGKKGARKTPQSFEEEIKDGEVLHIEKGDFDKTIQNEKLIFVQYWTAWCSLCSKIDATWDALASHFHDKDEKNKDISEIKIAKVDCIRNKESCDEASVDEFPTLNLYRNGKLEQSYTGPLKLDDLVDFVNQAIAKKDEL